MHHRRLLAVLGASLSLSLFACSAGTSAGPSITFMSGGGAYGDALTEAFLDPYQQESGVTIVDDPTLSYAKIQTQVEAKQVTTDVVPAEGYWSVQQCGTLLQPLNTELVDLSGIDPALVQDECGAPLLTYSTAIYYNTDKFGADGPDTCAAFFDPKTYPGKRSVRSSALPNPLLECALLADGVAADKLYPLDLDRAFTKIETIKDELVFWEAGSDSETQMASGEVDLIMAWNGRAHAAVADQDAPFAGGSGESLLIYDALVVPVGVADPDEVMKLINFMMRPEHQAKLTTLIPYSPSAKNAELTDIPEDLKPFLPQTNPKMAEGSIVQDQQWWAENADEVSDRWQSELVG